MPLYPKNSFFDPSMINESDSNDGNDIVISGISGKTSNKSLNIVQFVFIISSSYKRFDLTSLWTILKEPRRFFEDYVKWGRVKYFEHAMLHLTM